LFETKSFKAGNTLFQVAKLSVFPQFAEVAKTN
jgi:hypothetical protein